VFFNLGIVNTDKLTGLPGKCFYFTADEITKIGVAAVEPQYDKMNLIHQEIRQDLVASWNEEHGTTFTSMEELTEFYRIKDNDQDKG
jgi:hypothetical protein